jgi:prolipoprotein diacylglyceryltransferase
VPLASIPEPGSAAWGPLRAYALCLIVGIVVAVAVTVRRYRKAGGDGGIILDVAAWAIPLGLCGAFAHEVLNGKHGLWHVAGAAVAIIGLSGAIALGALGAWIACRRAGVPLGPVAGAAAPGVAFGLAIGSLAHWWAQDFYGRPASWWLAERIAPEHRLPGYENYATFQPAFLYESGWCVLTGLAVIWAAKRFALTGERTFMLAAAGYAIGGLWVESVRIGPQPRMLGMPYAAWGDLLVLVLALFILGRPRRPSRPYRTRRTPLPRGTGGKVPPGLESDSPGHVIST